jgi:hypothetical protein
MIEILHIQIVWQLPDMANLSVSQPLFIFRNYDKEPKKRTFFEPFDLPQAHTLQSTNKRYKPATVVTQASPQ